MLKKFPMDKINVTKNVLFFLSETPCHHSFIFDTFDSQFLYPRKHKDYLPETVCGIFHFRFRLVFIKLIIFVQQKAWTLFEFKVDDK